MKRLLAILLVLCITLAMCPITAIAKTIASGTYGNSKTIKWSLDSNGTLTISGKGTMDVLLPNGYPTNPWLEYRADITSVVIQANVTDVGDYAFYDCDNLTKVTIQGKITGIGESAFRSCDKLETVTFSKGMSGVIGKEAFSYCTALVTFTVPEGVEQIKEYAFVGCSKLSSVTLPKSVDSIYDGAFRSTALSSVTIPQAVDYMGWGVFDGCDKLKNVTMYTAAVEGIRQRLGDSNSLEYVHIIGDAPKTNTAVFSFHSNEFVIFYDIGTSGWTPPTWNGYFIVPFGHVHQYAAVVTKPTYTEQGYTTHTCSCGHSYVDSYVECLKVPEAEIQVARMILGNELAMQFAFKQVDIVDGVSYTAVITKTYADGRAEVVVEVPQNEWKTDGPYYYVSFNGIAAKEMSDKIYVQIYANGEAAGSVRTDSVREYAVRKLKDAKEAVIKALYVDMLNYGAAAQTYFGYDAANLANADLTAAEQAYATKTVKLENKKIDGPNYFASQLILANSIQLRVKFNNINSSMKAVATFTNHTGKKIKTEIDGSEFLTSGTVVVIDEVVAADYAQDVTITVYDANGNAVASVVDSVASYIARQMAKPNPAIIYDAVAKYCASAHAYLHK